MSSLPIYTGRWQDFSRSSGVLGDVVTLDVKWGGYLIAALSTFVGFVATSAWAIVAFWIHQSRARSGKADLLFAQHQAIYRNQGSAFTAAFDIYKLCWFWRKPKGGSARVEKLAWRSVLLSVPPLVIFIAFSVAALFVANVAGATYSRNDVLVAYNRCGFWQYQSTNIQGTINFQSKVSNDTLAGRSYSRTCYDTNTSLSECGIFPAQSLPVQKSVVPCPFGSDPTGHGLCLFGNNQAIQLDTGLLDSSDTFGINAPKKDRLYARKLVTCSPIYIKNYYNISEDPNGNAINTYYLGPLVGGTEYTWAYHAAAASAEVSYQVTSVFDSSGGWIPVTALQVATGDVSVHFLAQNTVHYLSPVDDLFFAAHVVFEVDQGDIKNFYYPDQYVTAMGCVDQYQFCNPNSHPLQCTIEANFKQLGQGTKEIGLTTQQIATAERLAAPFTQISTYDTVNSLGSATLLASDHAHELVGPGLPNDQWQIEMYGWFTTSLSKLQAYVLEFAANLADLGPDGTVEIPGNSTDPITQALTSMCSQQRIRNTGSYQTFSFLGLMLTICIGCAIILASWIVEPIVEKVRGHRPSAKHDYREVARIADHMLQLQRMALVGAGHTSGWDDEALLNNFPVTVAGANTQFPLASRQDPTDKDYTYTVAESLMGDVTAYQSPSGMHMHPDADSIAKSPIPQERFSHASNHSSSRPRLPRENTSQQSSNRDYLRSSVRSGRDLRDSVSDLDDSRFWK